MNGLQIDPPGKVLIVKPSALGDVVHALPVAGLIKRRWPGCHVSWLVSRPFAPLLETNPCVDEVIGFDRQRGGGIWRHSGNAARLARRLRANGFDLVLDLQGLFRSGWLTWQTGAPARVGLRQAREGAGLFYTHRVSVGDRSSTIELPQTAIAVPVRDARMRHAVERYLDLAEEVTGLRGPVEFPLVTTQEDEARVAEMLLSGGSQASEAKTREEVAQAVLLPGTNWPTKRWPAEHFAELGRQLRLELRMQIIIAGGTDAEGPAETIAKGSPGALNLAGRTTVRELVVLLRRAALVVCNDSGPMHLAAALGRPLVAPFGPTSPWRTGPYRRGGSVVRLDIPCSPCFSRRCLHQSCLQELSVAAVLERCRAELHAVP